MTWRRLHRVRAAPVAVSRPTGPLRRLAKVEVEESAEALPTNDERVAVRRRSGLRWPRMQLVIEPLVVPLEAVVLDVFSDGHTQVALTERHQLPQALGLDREDEALRVGVHEGSRLHRMRRIGSDRAFG